jgi:hypothetical protein
MNHLTGVMQTVATPDAIEEAIRQDLKVFVDRLAENLQTKSQIKIDKGALFMAMSDDIPTRVAEIVLQRLGDAGVTPEAATDDQLRAAGETALHDAVCEYLLYLPR